MTAAFDNLLNEIRSLHQTIPAVGDFVAFPDDLQAIDLQPRHLPCADYFLMIR